MPTIAVVILNYNGEALLRQFLPSVIRHTGNAAMIVADNGSTDQSVDLVQKEFPEVGIIRLDHNYGYCGGYNRALREITADYYVLLNSDVEVTPGWIDPLVKLLNNHPDIAAVQPKVLSYHERNKFEYAGAGGGHLDAFGYPFCRGRIFNFTETDSGQYDDETEVFWASGACMCIRASAFHEAGGFDESFFAHMEEIDLCWRLIRKGYRIYYSGKSAVFHVGAGTLSRSNPRKTYYNFRNALVLILKNLPGEELIFKLPLRLLLDWIAAVKFLLEGHHKDAGALFRAHFDVSLRIRQILRARRALKTALPFSTHLMTGGLLPFQYYILGKRRLL